MKKVLYFISFTLFFVGCGTDPKEPEECDFDIIGWCDGGYSFSIVNYHTYENLVGEGKLIDPDKIVVTNTRSDTMTTRSLRLTDGWYSIERFNPFQEIFCFDMCLSDSAFTRSYYLNYGGVDTDTMEVFFPEQSDTPEVSFNNITGNVPFDIPDYLGRGRSLYWFRKKIN